MASLQKYPGRGKDTGKTFYRIQPYLPNGGRVTIRLGTGRKNAEKAVKAITDLIECKKVDENPNATTKAWLKRADVKILTTLSSCGLVPSDHCENGKPWTLEILTENYIQMRKPKKASRTIEAWKRSRDNLFDKFGRECEIKTLTKQDGREFYRWLLDENKYTANTAKQRLRYARSFFEQAVEDGKAEINPFKVRDLSVTQTAAEKSYVEQDVINKVLEHTGNPEWKLLLFICRKIPLRIPSEIKELTWNDVDWENNKILIHSPKTKSKGKLARWVPIFPELKPFLDEVYFGEQDKTYVFPTI
ncbi:MAG: site-specific integrase, partial [Planctomycetota bacterium]|nr:site-specific integrase [Planctomycetota bacterium]